MVNSKKESMEIPWRWSGRRWNLASRIRSWKGWPWSIPSAVVFRVHPPTGRYETDCPNPIFSSELCGNCTFIGYCSVKYIFWRKVIAYGSANSAYSSKFGRFPKQCVLLKQNLIIICLTSLDSLVKGSEKPGFNTLYNRRASNGRGAFWR